LIRRHIFPGKHRLEIIGLGRKLSGAGGNQVTLDIQPCGYLQVQMRNFVRSSTDVAAEIDTMEMLHRSEQGQLVMTTGPFLEVTVHIRVQCANWFDINRVQILLNGKLNDRYNYTRREHGERFGLGVVKIELEVTQDTHIVVATAGEGLQLGPVMGADRGKQVPVAESNPVFVDSDGTGFTANSDRLGVDLPLVSE